MTEYGLMGLIEGGHHEKKRRKLIVLEVGTGEIAAEINNICDISSFDFSKDGRYFVLSSTKGTVTVWAINGTMRENIMQVLDSMALNPDFWNNYPLYLPMENNEEKMTTQLTKECNVQEKYDAEITSPPPVPLPTTQNKFIISPPKSVPANFSSQTALPITKSPLTQTQITTQRPKPFKVSTPTAELAPRSFIHPPQPLVQSTGFKQIDTTGKMPIPRIQTLSKTVHGAGEVSTVSLDGNNKKFNRGCTFFSVAKSLYGKKEQSAVKYVKQAEIPAPIITDSYSSNYHKQRVVEEIKYETEPEIKQVKTGYNSTDEAIATLLEKPILVEEGKTILPDPEDIDKDEEEQTNEPNAKRKQSTSGTNVETVTISACDAVDKMYEEIQNFNEKQQKIEGLTKEVVKNEIEEIPQGQ